MQNQVYKEWVETLSNYLREKINNRIPVVVIALSRKMPRLISWIKSQVLTPEECERFETLVNHPYCCFTTEHAIPFVFSDPEMIKKAAVIILDDIVITGDTINGVADEILHITGRQPAVMSIFAYKKKDTVKLPLTITNDKLPQIFTNIRAARRQADSLAQIVLGTGLPIDMEFPILHIDVGACTFEQVIDNITKQYTDGRGYELDIKENKSYTQLLDDDMPRSYNNDFAKIRVFPSGTETRLVCYAPNIIGEQQLNDSLFENEKYRGIWSALLNNHYPDPVSDRRDIIISKDDERRHRVSARVKRSLIVMANYLFSMSAMIAMFRQSGALADPDIRFIESDIVLLVGKSLAAGLTEKLNNLYNEGEQSSSVRFRVLLPTYLAPVDYEGMYDYLRAVAVTRAATVSEAISGIFEKAYSLKITLNKTSNSGLNRIGNKDFLESFESLYHLPKVMFHGIKGQMAVNRAVDELIDQAYVVPVYAQIEDEQGARYWRRFFHPSHTINQLYENLADD